jgi:general secretion pathway protein D
MSHHLLSRLSVATVAAASLGFALLLRAQTPAPAGTPPAVVPAPAQKPAAAPADEEIVGPVQMHGDTLDAVLVLVGKWTGRSIIRPQALPATEGYTISLPPMPKSEAVRALETMLDLSGIAVTPLGDKFLKVVPLGQARTEAPEMIAGSSLDLPPSGRIASKLFVLDFLRVSEIKDQITPLLNPNLGGPVLFEKTNALLITDSVSTIQRIEQLVKQLDQPAITGLQPKFYSLQFAKASDLVNKITAILKPPLSNQLSSATSLTADDRTNQIVLLCDPRQYRFFDELISKLDVKADPNTRNEVIYLKHATAKDVATLLTNLVQGRSQAATRTDQTGARPGQASSLPVVQPQPPGAQQAAALLSNLVGGANPTADFSSLVTVLADDRSNSIVVSGTVDDLRLIKEIVDKVDVLLAQVSIQVVIAEVSLSDSDTSGINALNLTIGTDAVRGTHVTNFDTAASGTGNSGIAGWNITSGVVNPLSFQAALTNTGAKNNVKILSANTIVTTHNKEADFKVTQQQPIITGSTSVPSATTTTTGLTTSSTVTYKDIGIEVKVTPLIGDDGSIQLQIDQIVDDIVGSVTIDGNQQPIIGHREATSFVNVQDGQMIVLGGLQQTKHTANRTKLGFLYEIPILSNLLGARTNETDRTELLLFVRPHVIPPGESTKDATKSIDQLSSKDQVHQYLQDPAKLPKESLIDRYYK